MEDFRAALDKTFKELERLEKNNELKPDFYMVTLARGIFMTLKDALAKGHKCCEDDD